MSDPTKGVYVFGPFRLDPVEGQLWRDSKELPLTQKALKVLTLLVENNGHVLDKNRFLDTLEGWLLHYAVFLQQFSLIYTKEPT